MAVLLRKKATVAVGHSILIIVYHLLKRSDSIYQDLGMHYFDQRDREIVQRRLVKVKRMEGMGLRVTIEPQAA